MGIVLGDISGIGSRNYFGSSPEKVCYVFDFKIEEYGLDVTSCFYYPEDGTLRFPKSFSLSKDFSKILVVDVKRALEEGYVITYLEPGMGACDYSKIRVDSEDIIPAEHIYKSFWKMCKEKGFSDKMLQFEGGPGEGVYFIAKEIDKLSKLRKRELFEFLNECVKKDQKS